MFTKEKLEELKKVCSLAAFHIVIRPETEMNEIRCEYIVGVKDKITIVSDNIDMLAYNKLIEFMSLQIKAGDVA